jgi:hypothetical protein
MSIRIDKFSNDSETVFRVSGRLTSPAAADLIKVCDPVESLFVMDLANLLFADDEGISAICAIAQKGAQIKWASPFVQLLLDHALKKENGW